MIIYRKATVNDLKDLVILRIKFLVDRFGKLDKQVKSNLEKKLKKYFKENIINNQFIAWIAEEDNKIIATSGLSFYQVPPSLKNLSGKVAYIMNMYTIPKYRKQGIASKLFDNIVKEAKALGFKKISLAASPEGISIYKNYGFKEPKDTVLSYNA